MPENEARNAALQEHFDRRMSELFAVLDKKNDDIVNLRVALGRLDIRVDQAASQTAETARTITAVNESVSELKESVAEDMSKINVKLDDLFHLRSFGRGMLMPMGVMFTVLLLGLGEIVRQLVQRFFFPHT